MSVERKLSLALWFSIAALAINVAALMINILT